ncbi:MAG: hypothetical protein ACXWBL_09065, partial [Usitatibacter sp.]
DQGVEEFAKHFIGRPNHWQDVVKRSVLSQRTTAPVAPKPKTEPNYVVHKTPDPAPAPAEEKRGLLGSLKSIIKKDQ